MRQTNSLATLVFIVILAIGAALAYTIYGISASWVSNRLIAATLIVAFVISFATKVADQWDRAVVLRLG
ncbi:MAG: slipin family protein, partial [Pseudolabrys sp.]